VRPAWGIALALALAGCGSSDKGVAVPAYGEHPATTVAAAPTDPGACRADAELFADDARMFLAHSGPAAAYPADLAFVQLREVLADFQARRCDSAVLGRALERHLTPAQRRRLVDGLPTRMAAEVRKSLGTS
jgi:hypothetical protein